MNGNNVLRLQLFKGRYRSKTGLQKAKVVPFWSIFILFIANIGLSGCSNQNTDQEKVDSGSRSVITLTPTQKSQLSTTIAVGSPVATLSSARSTNAATVVQLLPPWQKRWINGIPCRLPCWEGIKLGQTKVDEAMTILKGSNFAYQVTNEVMGKKLNYISWKVPGTINYAGQAFYFSDMTNPTVDAVSLDSLNVSLKDIIKTYGEPNSIIATLVPNEMGREFYARVSIIFTTIGLVGTTQTEQTNQKITLNENLILEDVMFFSPNYSDKDLTTILPYRSVPELAVKWVGFKDFDYYCRYLGKGEVVTKDNITGCKSVMQPTQK